MAASGWWRRKQVSLDESWRKTGGIEEPYNLGEMMMVTRGLAAVWYWLVGEPISESEDLASDDLESE